MAELPYINDNENSNWLRRSKLKSKNYDRVKIVSNRGVTVALYFKKDKLVGVIGDKLLTDILTKAFSTSLETLTGTTKETKKEIIHTTELKTYTPGSKGYIDAVLMDRVQNELKFTIG